MEARLKKLERMNRLLFAGLALALLPWAAGAATQIPDLIQGTSGKFTTTQTQQVLLVDDAGNKLGSLTGKKDASNLTIKDANGKVRLFVGLLKGNPTILFADKDGDTVATYAEQNGSFMESK
jgi:hypothetical protein